MINTPERVNIKQLVLPEPLADPHIPFDPKRDIPSSAWRKIDNWMEKFFRKLPAFPRLHPGNRLDALMDLARIAFICPEKVRSRVADPQVWDSLKKSLEGQHDFVILEQTFYLTCIAPSQA